MSPKSLQPRRIGTVRAPHLPFVLTANTPVRHEFTLTRANRPSRVFLASCADIVAGVVVLFFWSKVAVMQVSAAHHSYEGLRGGGGRAGLGVQVR